MSIDILSPHSIISLDDIIPVFISFLFVSLQGLIIYFAKRILTEQEALKSVVQTTAIKMAQLDTDVRYIANEIGVLSNNNNSISNRVSEAEKQIATLIEWKRSQTL